MGGMKKVWREAASLILTAHTPRTPSLAQSVLPVQGSPDWSTIFDYQVLMLRRSSKSKFMPSAYVFPGGVLSKEDLSQDWMNYFQRKGKSKDDLEELVLDKPDRPLLMSSEDSKEAVRRDIAFRLTAIRETFEESGILLYLDKNKEADLASAYSFSGEIELEALRKKVHNDPSELLKLYQELDLIPDLWSLTEWSDWLTPTDLHEQGTRRFDTLFYLCNIGSKPETVLDKAEISALDWTYPGTILHQFYSRQLWLAPPQVYELSRLLNFTELHKLQKFTTSRHKNGCTTWLPVRLQCDDGLISLLPGDSMYPDQPNYVGDTSVKQLNLYKGSLKDNERKSLTLNRLVFKDTYDCVPAANCTPALGHVNPLEFKHFQLNQFRFPFEKDDCRHCEEEQKRFCHKQEKDDWTGKFNTKDLALARNQEGAGKFLTRINKELENQQATRATKSGEENMKP